MFSRTTTGFFSTIPLRTTDWTVQAAVDGTGAVTADLSVQVSNDGTHFVPITTFSLSGTTSDSDVASVQGKYAAVRVQLTGIMGTGATATIAVNQNPRT